MTKLPLLNEGFKTETFQRAEAGERRRAGHAVDCCGIRGGPSGAAVCRHAGGSRAAIRLERRLRLRKCRCACQGFDWFWSYYFNPEGHVQQAATSCWAI